jgi:hypothetical protein
MLYYDLIYSEDDGGYYCDVYDRQGKDCFQTGLHATKEAAIQEAKRKAKQRKQELCQIGVIG